jgi:PII-like signaling protein
MIPEDARRSRIHLKANRTLHGRAIYRIIVERARSLGLAGASVFPVELSFGEDGRIGDLESEYSSHEVPVVVEIVDAAERIEALMTDLGPLCHDLFITVESVHALPRTPPSGGRLSGPGGA